MLFEKIIAECEFIISDGKKDYLQVIKNVNEYFLDLIKPKNLNGNDKHNVIVLFKVQFSELCIALMSNSIPDPEKMTVFRFYSALKYFENKNQKQKAHENTGS